MEICLKSMQSTSPELRSNELVQGSDNPTPGTVLETVPLEGIYRSWSIAMEIALGAKKKLSFVDRFIKIPEETSSLISREDAIA